MRQLFAFLATVVFSAAFSHGAIPVAHVLELEGAVQIKNHRDELRPAQFYGTVYQDEHLVLQAGCRIVLGFRATGELVKLKDPGEFLVTKTGVGGTHEAERVNVPDKHRPVVRSAVGQLPTITRAGAVFAKSLDDDPPAQELRSRRIRPIHGTMVLSQEPAFSWPPVANATQYQLVIRDLDQGTAWSVTTENTEWRSSGGRRLRTEARYLWDVVAKMSDGEFRRVCFGRFAVASDEVREEAVHFGELASSPEVPHVALAALWYQGKGLIDEAIQANEHLVKLAPESVSAREFLLQLYEWAGRHKDAERIRRVPTSEPASPDRSGPQ